MLYKVEYQKYEDVQEWESKGFNDLMEAIKFYFDKQEDNYYVQLNQKLMENLNEEFIIGKQSIDIRIGSNDPIYLECIKDSPDFTKGEKYMVLEKDDPEWNVVDDTKNLHIVSGNYSDDSWLLENFKIN